MLSDVQKSQSDLWIRSPSSPQVWILLLLCADLLLLGSFFSFFACSVPVRYCFQPTVLSYQPGQSSQNPWPHRCPGGRVCIVSLLITFLIIFLITLLITLLLLSHVLCCPRMHFTWSPTSSDRVDAWCVLRFVKPLGPFLWEIFFFTVIQI